MRIRAITLSAVAAITLLAACSSDSSTSNGTAAETTAAVGSDTTTPASTPTSSGDTSVHASGPHATEEFCTFQEDLNNAPSPLAGGAPTADDIESFITDTVRPAVQQLTDTAPAEMADDAAAMAEAYGKLADLFEKNGFDMTKTLADPDAAALNDDRYNTASANIDTYCGFSAASQG